MRLWVNTGTVNVDVRAIGTALKYSLLPSNNSFSNTFPFMINYLGDDTVGGVPAGTTNIVAGIYIGKPPVTSYAGVNLANSNASHLRVGWNSSC